MGSVKRQSEEAIASGNETTIGDVSVDAFHNDSFHVIQPKTTGYRSGLDALLVAAAVPANAKGIVADLGAGTGVAGLAALNLNADLDLVSVERNSAIVELLRKSTLLEHNALFRGRTNVIEADVTANATARSKAGLGSESVSHVIMNPPYNPITMRAPKDPIKSEAFMIGEGGIDAWFRTAASIVRPGGTLSVIYRTEQLGDIIACMQGRFGGLEIVPIHSKADEPAKRLVVRGTRGSRAAMAILPGFVVHTENGEFTSQAKYIFEGKGRLKALNPA